MKRKHRSFKRRVAWMPSALCGLALPAAAAPRSHVQHSPKSTARKAVACAQSRLAWRVQFVPANLPTTKSANATVAAAPAKKTAVAAVSLAQTPMQTGVSRVVPSFDMQHAAQLKANSTLLRMTSPNASQRFGGTAAVLGPRLAAAPVAGTFTPVRATETAAPVVKSPGIVTVAQAKAIPAESGQAKGVATKPVLAKSTPALTGSVQTIPVKDSPAKAVTTGPATRLAVVSPAMSARVVQAGKPAPVSDARGPAELSARHKDRMLLAQLEADLNRSENSLSSASKDLSAGQRQLAAFGDTLRAAMLEAGPDAKGLHPFVRVAQRYAGTPYVWGGESARGFDCSGFIIRVMRDLGYRALPHSAAEQFRYGLPIANALLKPGDLVFFANTYKPGISHVGIYLGRRRFIHAAGTGLGTIVSSLDSPKFRAKYAGARRLVTQ